MLIEYERLPDCRLPMKTTQPPSCFNDVEEDDKAVSDLIGEAGMVAL